MCPYQEKKVRAHYPSVFKLYWLPVKFCIDYNVLFITYKALNVLAPMFFSDLILKQDSPTQAPHAALADISCSSASTRCFSYS